MWLWVATQCGPYYPSNHELLIPPAMMGQPNDQHIEITRTKHNGTTGDARSISGK
jgi:hypothetical protein